MEHGSAGGPLDGNRMRAQILSAPLLLEDDLLAHSISQVLTQLHWDIEDDISQIIGDIPANQLSQATQHIFTEGKSASQNFLAMLTEYLQEEKVLLAKKTHVDQFTQDVDALRSHLARLEKKFSKLQQRSQHHLNPQDRTTH